VELYLSSQRKAGTGAGVSPDGSAAVLVGRHMSRRCGRGRSPAISLGQYLVVGIVPAVVRSIRLVSTMPVWPSLPRILTGMDWQEAEASMPKTRSARSAKKRCLAPNVRWQPGGPKWCSE
jgi:hypothetical protein